MKTVKIILIAFLLTPFAGFAQQGTPVEEAEKHTEWMRQNLELNEDQLEDVYEINEEYALTITKVINSDAEKQDKLNDLMAEREDYLNEIGDVLNEQQFAKFQEQEKTWFDKTKGRVGDTE